MHSNYVVSQNDPTQAMSSLDQYLRAGDACALTLQDTSTGNDSTVTAWGFTFDKNNPNYYTGVYITDSSWDPTNPLTGTPQLSYYSLISFNNDWYLSNYAGSNNFAIAAVTVLLSKTPGVAQAAVRTDIGINVGPNASPTIINNVVANLGIGIQVDPTSSLTVIGTTAYQNNGTNTIGVNNVTNNTFPIYLKLTDPLFVDAATGNFYPAEGSSIIDSALDSLVDRPNMVTVRTPLGIPPSPILVPDRDMFGQLRSDDPSVSPPPGQGLTTYKDRGAIDRVDFEGPTASLADPVDNGTTVLDNGVTATDMDPSLNNVTIAMVGETAFPDFAIQLDDAGAGVADDSVTADTVQVLPGWNRTGQRPRLLLQL